MDSPAGLILVRMLPHFLHYYCQCEESPVIKQLIIRGFKDQRRVCELQGLDLFSSAEKNGAGKSAVLESFKLALIGELPGRARTMADILRFTSLPEMSVGLMAETVSGEVRIERRFIRDAIKGEMRPILIDGCRQSYEAGQQWIAERIGGVSISFDPLAFLHLTDPAKRQWIVSNSPESRSLGRAVVQTALLAQVLSVRVGAPCQRAILLQHGVKRWQEILQLAEGGVLDRLHENLVQEFKQKDDRFYQKLKMVLDKSFAFWSYAKNSAENITGLLEFLKSQNLRLKNAVADQKSAIALIGHLVSADKDSLRRSIQQCRQRISELQKKLQPSPTILISQSFTAWAQAIRKRLQVCNQHQDLKNASESLANELEQAERMVEQLDAKLQSMIASIEALEHRLNKVLPDDAQDHLRRQEHRDKADQRDLAMEQSRLQEHLRSLGRQESVAELKRKLKLLQCEKEVYHLVHRLLGPAGVQGHLAVQIATELEQEVNAILQWIDTDYQFVLDLAGNRFEMGWLKHGTLIPLQTINSAHFILFIVPFLTAILRRLAKARERRALPTLRALCIEAECLTESNLAVLLKGLSKMKERGLLDNALVAHYHSLRDPAKLHGFREHILSASEANNIPSEEIEEVLEEVGVAC
jgi:hypothetical protein